MPISLADLSAVTEKIEFWQIAVFVLVLVMYFIIIVSVTTTQKDKIQVWFKRRNESWFNQNFFKSCMPYLMAIPPALVSLRLIESVNTWYAQHPFIMAFLVVWPLILLPIHEFIKDIDGIRPATEEEFSCLLNNIDQVVAAKSERFGEAAVEASRNGSLTDAKIFKMLTRPTDQFGVLTLAIYHYFTETYRGKNIKFRVILARMGEHHIESYENFFPKDKGPESTPDKLQTETCSFSRAKATKQIIIVPDVLEESQKEDSERSFELVDQPRARRYGSLVSFPVRHRHLGTIPYVLCICASKPNVFMKEDEKKLEFVLDFFGMRIALEHSLQIILERVRNNERKS